MLDADRGVSFEEGHGKVIEKTLSVQSDLDFRGVLGIVPFGGIEYTKCGMKLRDPGLFA